GHGGMTIVYFEPDPRTQAPKLFFSDKVRAHPMLQPLFQQFDLDRMQDRNYALLDGFLAKSKNLFGVGLEEDAQFKGLLFVIPRLRTRDFFDQPRESEKCLELFSIYVNESPEDMGILVASTTDLDDHFIDLVKKMRSEGLEYPER